MLLLSLLVVMAACLGYGLYLRMAVTPEQYASNRGQSSAVEIAFTVTATCVGGWMFFGVVAIGYEAGVVGYVLGMVYSAGLVGMALLAPAIKRALKESGSDTLDDFIQSKFNEKRVSVVVCCVNVLVFIAFLASQLVAFAGLLSVFGGLDLKIAVYLGLFVVVGYTAAAGFRGVTKTDKGQILMTLALSIALLIFLGNKVPRARILTLPDELFTGLGYGPVFLIGSILFLTPHLIARSDIWQRIASAKDERSARWGMLISAPLMMLSYFTFTSIGILARAKFGGGQQSAAIGLQWFKDEATSTVVLIAFVLGLFLAIFSTADSYLNLVAVTLVKNIWRKDWKSYEKSKSAREGKRLINRMSIATVMVGAVAFVFWKCLPNIVDLILVSVAGLLIFAPSIVHGLLSKQPKAAPVFWSILLGSVAIVSTVILSENKKAAFVPGIVVSIVVFSIGQVVVRKRAQACGRATATEADSEVNGADGR